GQRHLVGIDREVAQQPHRDDIPLGFGVFDGSERVEDLLLCRHTRTIQHGTDRAIGKPTSHSGLRVTQRRCEVARNPRNFWSRLWNGDCSPSGWPSRSESSQRRSVRCPPPARAGLPGPVLAIAFRDPSCYIRTVVGSDDFRRVLSHFTTGVTIVTTCDGDGRPTGLTASAFCSVSLD